MGGKRNFFKSNPPPNTFIGAVGATSITSPTDLAGKTSLNTWNIKNFNIDINNNVSCYVTRSYTINIQAFFNNSIITYYLDLIGRCTRLNSQAFHNTQNPSTRKILVFPNVTSCVDKTFGGGGAGTRNALRHVCVPKLEPVGELGTTNQNNFSWSDFFSNVYVETGNQTNNSGGVESDIADAISSNIGTWIKYSSNSNSPNAATGLNTIGKTTTSINLGWTAVTHSNTIDHYIVFANGNYVGDTSGTSLNVTGLTTATTYDFKILTIDAMGNNSLFSLIYTDTTL